MSVSYKCYQQGHKKSECPELTGKKEGVDSKIETPKSKARSFHITVAEAKMEPDVVTGTFTVNSIPTRILFDTGENKSFVSHRFIQHLSFTLTKLLMPMEVKVGKSFIVCDMCRDCKLNVDGEDYLVDLIPMSMGEIPSSGWDGLVVSLPRQSDMLPKGDTIHISKWKVGKKVATS
ncbi:putative transcription factor interactor and regulator CCHC(Zn) family [Helianthus annuus]|nr:putative transcription factor interactor and regulator CCHC(Zn) family [Helianthus annuus]